MSSSTGNPLKSTLKIPSLDRIKSTIENPVETKAAFIQVETRESEDKPVTQELLKTAWDEFTILKKKENKPSELVILNQEYTFADGKITLKLSNPVQLDQLNGFRVELLAFLRKKLENYSLDINPIIVIEEDKKMIYTSSDKFNHLVKKNPALLELKQKLGLDLDYS